MSAPGPAQVDLLAWPELRDAEARLREAGVALERAREAVLHAPHGRVAQRRTELQAANRASLEAGAAYRMLRDRLRSEGRA